MRLEGFTTMPPATLNEFSGRSGVAPKNCATGLLGAIMPAVRGAPVIESMLVWTCEAFDWPGVGARKPVLTDPRTAKTSEKSYRPLIFQVNFEPKSE